MPKKSGSYGKRRPDPNYVRMLAAFIEENDLDKKDVAAAASCSPQQITRGTGAGERPPSWGSVEDTWRGLTSLGHVIPPPDAPVNDRDAVLWYRVQAELIRRGKYEGALQILLKLADMEKPSESELLRSLADLRDPKASD